MSANSLKRGSVRRRIRDFRREFEALMDGEPQALGEGDLSDLADFVFGCASRGVEYDQMAAELGERWAEQFGESPAFDAHPGLATMYAAISRDQTAPRR